ncbi:MAG: TonB family protein [Betaproteobacteria bacterium]
MLASLVLHALLLFLLPVLREAKRQLPAPPLTAHLAEPRRPDPVVPKVEPVPLRPFTSRPSPAVRPVPQPVVAAPVVATPVLSVEPSKQAPEPAFVVPSASQAPVARIEAQPAAQAASGPDPGTVAQFRLELMDLARRYKRYPRVAQDNNWEGRVELRIVIGEDGAISSLTVKKGAGRSVLDDEAMAMIRTAKSKATIPPALRGKAFSVEFPVDFFLKDGEK